jgi:hypothetical protein
VHIREQPNSNIQCPFKLLQWNVDSEIQLIRVNDIITPACLFSFQEANVSVAPTTKFWHMEWKFCDRECWEENDAKDVNVDVVDFDCNMLINTDPTADNEEEGDEEEEEEEAEDDIDDEYYIQRVVLPL